MPTADAQPTLPLPDRGVEQHPPKRRRRVWPWIVAIVIVAGLAVGAWFAGEAIARQIVTTTIREQVITQLSLPADQQVDVDVSGAVLPQLIRGELDDVTLASDDVAVGPVSADVSVRATGIPISGDAAADSAAAVVRLDQEQLRALLATVDELPVETIEISEPSVSAEVAFEIFGARVPVALELTPAAVDGELVLTPASLQLAGATITADELRDRFGGVADLVVKDYTVCIAQYLPAGVTLSGLSVDGAEIVADLDVDGAIISDPALRVGGTCP